MAARATGKEAEGSRLGWLRRRALPIGLVFVLPSFPRLWGAAAWGGELGTRWAQCVLGPCPLLMTSVPAFPELVLQLEPLWGFKRWG